jgi:hypothetical protein
MHIYGAHVCPAAQAQAARAKTGISMTPLN